MLPRRLALALLLAVAALAAACNIGPQPLPPGAEDDNATGGASMDGGSVRDPSLDAGAAAPSLGDDSGTYAGDGGTSPGDARSDASADASADAASDAAADAGPGDAGSVTNDF